jgi:hypothetical protein
MRRKHPGDAFEKLAAEEERFPGSEFLAPAVRGGTVCVRIAGVVCRLRVSPAAFEGWGVFRATSHVAAVLVCEAGLAERARYLELFPLVRLILCRQEAETWLGASAHRGDRRWRIDGMVPVRLVTEAQPFDVVRTRFDGGNFWFESPEPARDPATAAYLRRALTQTCDPNQLDRPGLTLEERTTYAACYFLKEEVRREQQVRRTDQTLRDALGHAGAELLDVLERRDGYRVTFRVGGREHVSAVSKDDLSVQVAGICLSGQDHRFDLASLVGVIREAEGEGGAVPIGRENDGMREEDYWRVHPPGG